jgi:predicted PurR-regulated permease PerM
LQHPLAVTAAFLIVSNLDGFFIAPRIVGDAVVEFISPAACRTE